MVALELVEPAVDAVAVAGTNSVGSAVKLAESPVTFLHTLGGEWDPETKLTAAHCVCSSVVKILLKEKKYIR